MIMSKFKEIMENHGIFIITAILFAISFMFIQYGGDDLLNMRNSGHTILSDWQEAVKLYSTWSSRTLVSFVLFFFEDHAGYLFPAFMGLCMYILLYSISELFVRGEDKESEFITACLVLSYCWQDLSTAGWIATMTTYFCPIAFGFLTLVPIRKYIENKPLRWYEYLLYSASLIYAANNEQVMVILLFTYFVFLFCFLVKRKYKFYLVLQFALCVISCLYILRCPGNYARKISEIRWFPTYGMLNLIDKAELGYSTTAYWLFFGDKLFVLLVCAILFIAVWQKYQDHLFRWIAAIPFLIVLAFGPLNEITTNVFPNISKLTGQIPYYGLVNVENGGNQGAFFEFMILSITLVFICIEFVLTEDKGFDLIFVLSMLVSGFLSRMAMGFTPTVYASSYRTFSPLAFCIIAAGAQVYSHNLSHTKSKSHVVFLNVMKCIYILSFADLWGIIYSAFR